MSPTTDTNTKVQFVVMRWDIDSEDGYHFVGPFPDVHTANRWGAFDEDTHTNSPCWHTELVDPTRPLPIKSPDRLGDLTLDPKLYGWRETSAICVSAGTGWYLLMTDAEPLHLVGPFVFHRVACAWGCRNEAEGASYGWQVIWLWDPTAPIKLIEPGVFVDAE